jgi:hypothetical protein
MAAEFEAKMDTSGIEAFARDFVKKYRAGLTDALIKSANQMVGALQVSTQTTLEKGRHTGRLRKSWKAGGVYFADSDEASIDVFSGLPYALIHDRGGVIKPSRAKALAIPNEDNTWFFKGFNKDLPSPSELRRTKPAWAKQLWFDKKTGTLKDVKGQVAYFLRRSVRMPARHYIGDAVNAALPEIHAVFEDLVETIIQEGAE